MPLSLENQLCLILIMCRDLFCGPEGRFVLVNVHVHLQERVMSQPRGAACTRHRALSVNRLLHPHWLFAHLIRILSFKLEACLAAFVPGGPCCLGVSAPSEPCRGQPCRLAVFLRRLPCARPLSSGLQGFCDKQLCYSPKGAPCSEDLSLVQL